MNDIDSRLSAVVLPLSARSRAQWALGELALVAAAASRARVQLLHSLANFGPPYGRFRRIVTIHDLQHLALPELLPWHVRIPTNALVRVAARGSDRIIAVSNAGAAEIRSNLRVPSWRIDVVPNGVRPPPCVPDDVLGDGPADRSRPLVLAVATNLPHKNLGGVIRAISLFDPSHRPFLCIAGHATGRSDVIALVESLGVTDDVRLLGSVAPVVLESLYAQAQCFVLASRHEGFGLPVLEAMARSVPVACSDIPALREVAGDAALFFDPASPGQIQAAIEKLLGNEPLVDNLRRAGQARARQFSWSAAAAGTLASYRAVLADHVSRQAAGSKPAPGY